MVRGATGRAVGHHVTCELTLPDGRVLRTRVSRLVNTTTYGAGLWHTILHDQLEVGEAEFWRCVDDRIRPERGVASPPSPRALPAQLVHQLIHQAGVPADQVAQMSLDQATSAMVEYWSRPR